ncbi:MAG: Asp-tRNA(Asn)/Glu-tRNA(Gln) amidotransferase subunit GatC [Candidatus Woesearchaeota archaeon]
MKVDRELIEHVAEVARLRLSEGEIKRFVPELKEILVAFSEIDQLDLTGIEPSYQPVPLTNTMREDAKKNSLSQEEALLNSKHTKDGFFKGASAV